MTPSVNGLSPLEAAVLTTLFDLGAEARRPHHKTALLLAELDRHRSLWPYHTYPVVLALARPWVTRPTLIDHHGNAGSPDGDAPAHPRYTEVRLTPVGEAAARAERGERPPLPLGLVVGNRHGGGSRPAFDPSGVVAALLALRTDPAIDDAALHQRLGPPADPSGCEVSGPIDRLLAGRAVELELRARIVEEEPGRLVISHCPVAGAMVAPWSPSVHPLDLMERDGRSSYMSRISNESDRHGQRYVVDLADVGAADDAVARLRTLWPLAMEAHADLGAPWRSLAQEYLSRVAHVDDLATHLAILAPLADR